MKIVLARIDDRLIHGQVATVWSKVTGCQRIIVCDDDVAKDTDNEQAEDDNDRGNVLLQKSRLHPYHLVEAHYNAESFPPYTVESISRQIQSWQRRL